MIRTKAGNHGYQDMMESPVGTLYLLFESDVLVGISFSPLPGFHQKRSSASSLVARELREYFLGGRRSFSCRPAFTEGTDFERSVWNELLNIPYGETRTYKWIAERVGRPRACRAAGNALGKNPIPIIIPCHRVIESDGSIGGYSSGVDIKRRLLELEYYTVRAGG